MPPDAAADAARAATQAALRAAAGPDGFLGFDRVVEIAQYDPASGYYARPGRRLGKGGDFYTAAHASPLFGATIARRARAEFDRLGGPNPFRVVELGPGDGTLAVDFVSALAADLPAGVELEYVLVERSATLADAAAGALAERAEPGRVEVRRAASLGGDGPFVGFVVANEVLDAMPFRRVVARGEAWSELGIRWDGTRFVWAESALRPVPGPPLPRPERDGTVLEISPLAEALLREIGDHLAGGSAILVDYGREEPELLAGPSDGTLAAVRGHRPVADPLAELGVADVSAFVDFTRIRAAAARAGLVETAYLGQAEALIRWGLPELLEARARAAPSPEEEVRTRLAGKNLIFGFAEFRVLEVAAGPGAATPSPADPPPGPAPRPSPR